MQLVRREVKEAPLYEPPSYSRSVVARLDLNENPFPPPDFVVEAVLAEARRANRYPEKELYDRLYMLLGDYTGVDERLLAIGPGGDGLIQALISSVVGPGDRAVCIEPSFPMYTLHLTLKGASVEKVGLEPCGDKWCLDLTSLVNSARNARMIIIDNPNNPTGSLLVDERSIRELIEETRALIVVDEAYYEFSKSSVIGLVEETDRLVVLRTLSKAFSLAGLRIGYMAGSRELRDAVWKHIAPFPVSRVAAAAAVAALEHREYFARIVDEIIRRRMWLRSQLNNLGVRAYKSWTNFILVDTGIPRVAEKLARKGVRVQPTSLGDTWIRVSVGAPEELKYFIEVLGTLV
ncbi:MAG: histidinol-phosphate transaminase [Pyrodictiaceae archaeon]